MAVTTKNQRYDHEVYTTRHAACFETGAGATTAYAKFVAFTTLQLYAATCTVTVAGTATTNTLVFSYIQGTLTTALGTCSFGVATSGVTSAVTLGTQSTGGFQVTPGGYVQALTGADATGKVGVAYEYSVTPLANIVA